MGRMFLLMNRLASFLVLLAFVCLSTISAVARMGETYAECVRRYGSCVTNHPGLGEIGILTAYTSKVVTSGERSFLDKRSFSVTPHRHFHENLHAFSISASYAPNRCSVLGVVDSTFSEPLRGWAEKWEKNLLPAIPEEPPRSLSGF